MFEDAIKNAIEAKDDEACREKLLQLLNFGTDPSRIPEGSSTTLEQRTQQVCKILTSIDRQPIEQNLVDVLWLVSCSIIAAVNVAEKENASDDKKISQECKEKENEQALITIIQNLLEDSTDSFMIQLQSHLDPALLNKVGLISSENELVKKMRLLNTKNYRQQKYNLLQEESEGYSKLLHSLTHFQKIAHKETILESGSLSSSVNQTINIAEVDFNYIQHLVGTFQLDPNRVLDIAVDVLEFQLFQRSNQQHQQNQKKESTSHTSMPVMPIDWMKQFSLPKLPPLIGFKLKNLSRTIGTKTITKNSIINKNTVNSVISMNTIRLFRTIAYLARHKLINLKDLNLYLPPITKLLEQLYDVYQKKELKRVRSLGKIKLSSPSSASYKKELEEEMKVNRLIDEQKDKLYRTDRVQLLRIILIEQNEQQNVAFDKVGNSSESTLSSWNLLQQLFTSQEIKKLTILFRDQIANAICDFVHNQISGWVKYYIPMPFHGESIEEELVNNKDDDGNKTSTEKTELQNDRLRVQPTTLEDFVNLVSEPLLCTIGSGSISVRPVLFCDLCRLFRALLELELKSFTGDGIESYWVNASNGAAFYQFLKSFLIPSLSFFSQPNPALNMELWNILKLMPYTTRYRLYREWRGNGLEKEGLLSKSLLLVESEMKAGKDARYILKRLSNDNIRQTSRQVAKVTHSNPLVVFTTILNQIESYDNLVPMMVDAVRFVAPLSLDVLGYCILSRLCGATGGVNRSRSKESGVNVSQWLQSLESFIGAFYKRCPFVEIRGILGYVVCRLRDGFVTELGVLSSLLKDCGGCSFADYSPAASLNLQRLEGRAGSTPLKRETMTFGVVEDLNKSSSDRLRSIFLSHNLEKRKLESVSLCNGKGGEMNTMGVSLLILLAQARSRIIFGSNSKKQQPVKLLSTLYDSCQVVMAMLLEFISYNGDEEHELLLKGNDKNRENESRLLIANLIDYGNSMPSLVDLHKNYGIDVATAWMLCRPLVRAVRSIKEEEIKNENRNEFKTLSRIIIKFSITDQLMRTKIHETMLPKFLWDDITPDLFETFFSHSTYDLFCPRDAYVREINRLDNEVQRLLSQQSATWPSNQGTSSANDELERHERVSLLLSIQLKKQANDVNAIHDLIKSKKNILFASQSDAAAKTQLCFPQKTSAFLSHCIFPRCMQSPDDAFYCSHFVSLMHKIETPGFSTLNYLDELIPCLSRALYGVTEGEAANLSILLLETWKNISKWRYDKKAYQDEMEGKPGSFMFVEDNGESDEDTNKKVGVEGKTEVMNESIDEESEKIEEREEQNENKNKVKEQIKKEKNSIVDGMDGVITENGNANNMCGEKDSNGKKSQIQSISYEKYESLFVTWHANIGSAALGCLKSKEYIHTRACLIVLTRIVDVFPSRPKLGNQILKALIPLQDDSLTTVLPDIRIAAQAYNTQLLKARDNGVWKEEDEAVVQARVKKEQEKIERRKQKLAQQFEDMKKENQQISKEIGENGRSWEIRRRIPGGDVWGNTSSGTRSATQKFDSGRGEDRRSDRRGDRGDAHSRRADLDRGGGRDRSGRGVDEPRSLEGRWTQSQQSRQSSSAEGGGRNRPIGKRIRSPSPPSGTGAAKDVGISNDEHNPAKRARIDPGSGALSTGRSPLGGRRGRR